MPAIDLSRLKKQTAQLVDLFGQPVEFLRAHREVLDFYVNRTLRSQSVAPSSVLPTYRTPTVVLRQIENELGPVAGKQPIQALELADALWDEGWLETRLLAAFLLGRIPPQEERLLARLTAWTQAVRLNPGEFDALVLPGGSQGAHDLMERREVLACIRQFAAAGKLLLDVGALGVDLLTLAFHKCYGPKGIGALYIRHGTPLKPILFGADQEHGLRPGTENVALIVGAGEAARLARERLPEAAAHQTALVDLLHRRLADAVPGLTLNGHPVHRLPNTLHVSFPGVSGRELLAAVAPTLAASVGSACHSHDDAVSGVLAAMGCDAARARGAVRLSVGRDTTADEIEIAAAALIDALATQRD